METLFNYLASLGSADLIKYFILLSLTLALFPYSETILKYLKHFVHRKELEIIYFDYYTQTIEYKDFGDEKSELNVTLSSQKILINDSIINFVWKVEGALKIDLLPIGKKLNGNACADIINSDKKKYTLVAHGFNGQKIESVIDLSDEIFYSLQTNPLASNQNIIRTSPTIGSAKFSNNKTSNFKLTETESNKLINWLRTGFHNIKTNQINLDYFVNTSTQKTNLSNTISRGKILKSYTFSTKKYQSLN
jgi:hypothetical protein